ncbi:MAG: IS3 family transposase [Eggerthellaceae bacterium]
MIRELSGQGHALKDLLAASGLPASTYHYNREKPAKPPTRPELRAKVAEIFGRTPNGCGHRQIAMCLRAEEGVRIADKTVLKMMHEIGISCGIRRETDYHRYNSYKGVVGKTFENLIGRDFSASGTWQKMGTDVTEFAQPWGKAYLAPVLDFFSEEVVAWSVSQHPGLRQQDEMLDMLIARKPEGKTPILTSDMGWQYQHERYWKRVEEAGFRQSMSRKGNCLDNACTEGLFGHIKDEFFRGQEWPDFESFKADLEAYIVHWNTVRRQKRLEGLTPVEYGNRTLETAA